MNDETKDRLERLIGLKMDGRLEAAEARELEGLLHGSAEARELEQALLGLRAALRAAAPPAAPQGLRGRILERVAGARARSGAAARVLPLARRLAAAAALLLCASLFAVAGGLDKVQAQDDPILKVRTIEDELRASAGAEGQLHDFLAWRFLGRRP